MRTTICTSWPRRRAAAPRSATSISRSVNASPSWSLPPAIAAGASATWALPASSSVVPRKHRAVLPRAPRARLQRQGARLSSPRFHLQALPLANLARGCRMIFRSEEDFDRTLDEFAKARRAWPLYLARSVRLRSPVIGNLAGRRSKENPAAQRRRRGSRPSSTALRRRWIEFGCCSSAGLFSSWR